MRVEITVSNSESYGIEGPNDIREILLKSHEEVNGNFIVLDVEGKEMCLLGSEFIEAIHRCIDNSAE